MGTIIDWPSWDLFVLTLKALLHNYLYWLLSSPWGKWSLVLILILLVLWAVNVIHGNVKDTDSFNIREDYWR